MRFLLLATSLALTGCLAGAGAGGSAGSCYSDGPLASNVVLSPAMAAVGEGGGNVIVSVSYDYRTRSGAKIILTRYRVEDSNGNQLINAYIEKNLKGSGSYTFNVPIETDSAETFTIRVQAVDECFENSKWAEAIFDVVAVAALAGKTSYATAMTDDALYFVGGLDNSGQLSDTLLRYDPVTRQATTLSSMPEGRELAAAAIREGIVYVFGGRAYGIEYESAFAYDIAMDTWTAVAPMAQPMAGGTATARYGLIYVTGGQGLQAYDPVLDLWMQASSLTF